MCAVNAVRFIDGKAHSPDHVAQVRAPVWMLPQGENATLSVANVHMQLQQKISWPSLIYDKPIYHHLIDLLSPAPHCSSLRLAAIIPACFLAPFGDLDYSNNYMLHAQIEALFSGRPEENKDDNFIHTVRPHIVGFL